MANKQAVKEKSKSQHVRDYVAKNPEAKGPQVRAAMAKKGVDVSLPTVYKVIALAGDGEAAPASAPAKKRRTKKRQKAAAPAAPAKTRRATDTISISELVEAKKLADQLGGVEQAKKAMDTLAKLR